MNGDMSTYHDYAAGYLNARQGSAKHHQIVDLYNGVLPRPRGYKVTYADAWCAAFATVCMDQCGAIDPPRECSVPFMWEKCKTRIVKSPANDDLIFYDWDGDGVPDHVGIVYGVGDTYVLIIEGNKSKTVGTRVIKKNSKYIYGYARIARAVPDAELVKVARDVIRGAYGNGAARKKKLAAAGYDAAAVQKKVNELLKA